MDFTNTFTVNVPLERVWAYMLDPERVTPCVPGAQLTETLGDHRYKGTVKVKLGAVQMQYRGELEMEEDEPTRTIMLRAKGTEARGSGGASGTVMTRMSTDETGATTVVMESHVDVTGRVAQFGRGIMQDVANRLVKEFAQCLEAHLTAEQEAGTAAEPTSEAEARAPSLDQVESQAPGGPPAQEAAPPARSQEEITPAPTSSEAPSAASGTSARVPAPPVASAPPQPAAAEIRAFELLLAVARSRLAALLRFLADKLEPSS